MEGILYAGRYGTRLQDLVRAHRGVTRCYYLHVPYTETVLRHATKPDAEYLKSQATALEALKTFALGSGEGSIKVELVAEGAKAVVDAGLPEPELCPGWGVSTTGGAPTHTRLSAGGAGRFCPRTCW